MKTVVIVGGGITGLATAHRLIEQKSNLEEDLEVILIEASSRLGGIIQTEERDGFLLERGPDSFVSEKPEALELARRIGLESHLIQTNDAHRRSFIVREGRLLPVPEGFHLLAPARLWPFLTSEIFTWAGKVRLAMDLILPRTRTSEADESVADFVRRRLGREALERMAQPMVAGIHTADPEQLSLRATFPGFLEMEQQHRSLIRALQKTVSDERNRKSAAGVSGARYSLFLSFDRGMQLLVDQLSKQLEDVKVQLRTRVDNLSPPHVQDRNRASKAWQLGLNDGQALEADAVCIALPAHAAANLLRETNEKIAHELLAIPHASSATINLAYKREDIPHPLDGFGFVVPFVERRTLLACTFSSIKFAGRSPQGFILLRAFVGGALQPELLDLDEDELLARVRGDLKDLLGIVKLPLFSELSRWYNSMPQYHVGHLERVARIAEMIGSTPGLALAGNAYSGVGIPDCIRSGERAVENLIKGLSQRPERPRSKSRESIKR